MQLDFQEHLDLARTSVTDGQRDGDALVVELPAAGAEHFAATAIDVGEEAA